MTETRALFRVFNENPNEGEGVSFVDMGYRLKVMGVLSTGLHSVAVSSHKHVLKLMNSLG